MLYRHGDVIIQKAASLPEQASSRPGATLARGELTGHSHRFADPSQVQLWQDGLTLYAEVIAPHADLIHQEHRTIALPRGLYRVWMQREYSPEAIRRVVD